MVLWADGWGIGVTRRFIGVICKPGLTDGVFDTALTVAVGSATWGVLATGGTVLVLRGATVSGTKVGAAGVAVAALTLGTGVWVGLFSVSGVRMISPAAAVGSPP